MNGFNLKFIILFPFCFSIFLIGNAQTPNEIRQQAFDAIEEGKYLDAALQYEKYTSMAPTPRRYFILARFFLVAGVEEKVIPNLELAIRNGYDLLPIVQDSAMNRYIINNSERIQKIITENKNELIRKDFVGYGIIMYLLKNYFECGLVFDSIVHSPKWQQSLKFNDYLIQCARCWNKYGNEEKALQYVERAILNNYEWETLVESGQPDLPIDSIKNIIINRQLNLSTSIYPKVIYVYTEIDSAQIGNDLFYFYEIGDLPINKRKPILITVKECCGIRIIVDRTPTGRTLLIDSLQLQKIINTTDFILLTRVFSDDFSGQTYLQIINDLQKVSSGARVTWFPFSMELGQTDLADFKFQFATKIIAFIERSRETQALETTSNRLEIVKDTRNMMIAVSVVLVGIISLVFVQYTVIKKKNIIINKEKERAKSLLLNILPSETAKELEDKGSVEAKSYDDVTVLFTDFDSFTKQVKDVMPNKILESLNFYFTEFDKIAESFGLEKIKTIGDSYMCAAGVPSGRNHPLDVIKAGSAMLNKVTDSKSELQNKDLPTFDIRIGIHSGPVVAGIVGIKKFQYDIWGDTVNIASRMESYSDINKISISQAVYDLVGEDINCTYRGDIQIENYGKVGMYFVDGVKS